MDELNPELYTVAWIAPLEIEAKAALYMLDNEHQGRFALGRGDDYVFQAGDINGHNVVVATLPPGQEYGTGSAAALASQVKKFFPHLWFGLLVGVAAGLPNLSQSPPLDIRLGDVLVALPKGDSAGLVAYDLGKETGSGGFQLLSFGRVLANTEPVVRSAIGSIKMKAPNDTQAFLPIYEAMKDKEHSDGNFHDPGQERDRLYHIDDHGVERLVKRVNRPDLPDPKRTRVWYGPIGSGDKLMKNARKRNELRDKYGVIGLEMEAAGTMNRIPVGVIRGVCDYGDEHKNKEWQPYAAAMAAAFAKAVLYQMGPGKSVSKQHARTVSKPLKGLVLCELPPKAERFFGRTSELSAMKSHLETTACGRRGVTLCGIPGSGKTQLVLEYFERERENLSAILWINAASETSIQQSLGSCATRICQEIPEFRGREKDTSPLFLVLNWLQTTPHRNWLVVIDSVDNLFLIKPLLDSLRELPTGAICLASTHLGAARLARTEKILVERLDQTASQSLILWRALDAEQNPGKEVREAARRAARVLDGFALGLELAGILIHEGIVSLNAFPAIFESKYRQLTLFQVDPGMWMWSKPDSVFGMFDALYKFLVGKSAMAALLLTLCSIYGPSELPVSFLRRLELYDVANSTGPADDWAQLQSLIHDEVEFNMAAYELHKVFLAKKRQDGDGSLLSISLHGSICQWRFATIGEQKAEWIMQASYGLARHIESVYNRQQKGTTVDKSTNTAQRFLYLFDRCLDRIRKHVPEQELELPNGKYATQYFTICSCMAHAYLSVGKFETSKKLFSAAIEYMRTTQECQSDEQELLRLLRGFATSCQKKGDLTDARDALQSALVIAESRCGHMSDETVEIHSQLKTVSERIAVEMDNHKRVLVASTGGKRRELENSRQHSMNNSLLSIDSPKGITASVVTLQKAMDSSSGMSWELSLAEPTVFVTGFDNKRIQQRSSLLRGKLHLNVRKNAKIKSITLNLIGKVRTEWPEGIPPLKIEKFEEITLRAQSLVFIRAPFDVWGGPYGSQCRYSLSHTGSNTSTTNLTSPLSSKWSTLSSKELKRLSLQSIDSQSFGKSDSPFGPKDYKIFYSGLYEYSFELPIDHFQLETTELPFGSVKWEIDATVERAGPFKPDLRCTKEVNVVRLPDELSQEMTEPIYASGRCEDHIQYDVFVPEQSFPVGSKVPVTLKVTPLDSGGQIHILKVFATESVEYHTRDKRVMRNAPRLNILLLEKVAGQPLSSEYNKSDFRVLDNEASAVRSAARQAAARRAGMGQAPELVRIDASTPLSGPQHNDLGSSGSNRGTPWSSMTEIEMNVQLPTCRTMAKDENMRLHPDCSWTDVDVCHWIKIVLRVSRPDPDDLTGKRRRTVEISFEFPFTLLNCRATQAQTCLPGYSDPGSSLGQRGHPSCGCPDAEIVISSDSADAEFGGSSNPPLPTPWRQAGHIHPTTNSSVGTSSSSTSQPEHEPRPGHRLRHPSFTPTTSDADGPLTLPPKYDVAVGSSSTDALADYFARLADHDDYDDDDD